MEYYIVLFAKQLARASNHSPTTVIFVMLAIYMAFNLIESIIERLLYGERFVHWLDPIFMVAFLGFTAISIYFCNPE